MHRRAAHADVFLAIADPTRRRILDLLADGERPVAEIADRFDVSLPAISQQLSVLRAARLVRARPLGRQRLYRIAPAPLREVARWLAFYERFWTQKLRALGEHLDRKYPRKENPQ